ncbi:MAG TPA: integrase core domain-containing protein, partial [Planctomycetota bacterium]|nr:integrase core domain-containing protein [Planctomycetota bacterium]
MPWPTLLLFLLRAAVLSRRRLLLENVALRQQLALFKQHTPRPTLADRDRLFWLAMRRLHAGWRDCLLVVQPDTVVRWHRKGWRWYWRRKSRSRRPGRPAIGWVLVKLIRRLARENPLWGAQQIRSQLLLLGHDVGLTTVKRYLRRERQRGSGQSGMTFLRNHLKVTAACDFFTVPTVTFRSLFVFVVLSHDRRLIRRVAVTAHPTAEWTARQLVEAFPDEAPAPQLLIRDRDGIYGDAFSRQVRAMTIGELLIRPRQSWMNCYVERVIGTLQRECTDKVIVLGERQLQRLLDDFVAYYNSSRCHMALDGNSPVPRIREQRPAAEIHGTPRKLGREDRFLLQVEGGRVDHAAHANDIATAVHEMV